MIPFALSGLLAAMSTRAPAVVIVDVIERNHVLHPAQDCEHIDQYIFWELAPERDGPAYRCVAWRLVKNCGHVSKHPNGYLLCWSEDGRPIAVWSATYWETWTVHDVELADRQQFPESQRRGLK
jgi:hypothetical protein